MATTDLTQPGAARKAVGELVRAAGGLPVIKLDVSRSTATLSALKDGRIAAWQWDKGLVRPVESDIEYIQQATFSPADYQLDDLGQVFDTAAELSGSRQNQQLQIVEYDHGEVLMTVTTRPESRTVFLRPNGTPINQLDFSTAAGFEEAIRDTTKADVPVLAMGWHPETGFWSDRPGAQKGVVRRTTRQARLPAWSSERKAASDGPAFLASSVDPDVLTRLVATLPAELGRPEATVTVEISRQHQMALPVMTFDVDGQKVVTTLSGTDITQMLGG
ncbi:hypothetical protein ACTQ49_04760 [Luteococcus sp. Sow4_B9]|uniref:hypothetical protein n=1 Tax=Luteococcus sp. Sow4_B9 TaxID=3438792 RepID=UPI003F9733EF